MEYIQPFNRHQLSFGSLEDSIEEDNPVRFVEAFVEQLDLTQLGYVTTSLKSEGRPPFHPKLFLKLYLYGYLNGIRSSRRLEKESKRNIELQWLLGQLVPNYHSIADFRKVNPKALRNTFKLFVLFLKEADLIAGKTIAIEAKENLQAETLTALLDKGYHNGREIQTCKDHNISTICAQQEIVNSNEHGTTEAYLVTKFIYNETDDTYTCPEGKTLTTTGSWHKKSRARDSYQYKKYRTPECKNCPVKHLCTGRQKGGREIERSEYAQAVAENAQRYKANKALYRKRQEINEHIFGTIKRKWGYNYTDLNGLEKVNGEHSLICLVYNIKRAINILGMPQILEKLKNWKPNYRGIHLGNLKRALLEPFYATEKYEWKIAA